MKYHSRGLRTPENIAKLREAKLGRKRPQAVKDAIRAGMLRAWAKRNPIRVHKLTPELRYYVSKLYKNGFRGEAIREALEESKA